MAKLDIILEMFRADYKKQLSKSDQVRTLTKIIRAEEKSLVFCFNI